MTLLEEIRAGLASPFADRIAVGASVLTRAEARAVEWALSGSGAARPARRWRIVFFGVEAVR